MDFKNKNGKDSWVIKTRARGVNGKLELACAWKMTDIIHSPGEKKVRESNSCHRTSAGKGPRIREGSTNMLARLQNEAVHISHDIAWLLQILSWITWEGG